LNLQVKTAPNDCPLEIIEEYSELFADAFIIPVCSDEDIHSDENINALVKEALELKEFSGKKGEELIFFDNSKIPAKRLIFLGIGKKKDAGYEAFRSAAGRAVKLCIKKKLKNIVISVPSYEMLRFDFNRNFNWDNEKLVKAIGEGAYLGNFSSDFYKTKDEIKLLKKISLLIAPDSLPDSLKGQSKLVSEIDIICKGTIAARIWTSMPSIYKTPDLFADMLVKEAKEIKDISINVFEEKDLKNMGMGGILAVGMGSEKAPKLLVFDYNPKSKKKACYAFVGKGVTFDSGGINLKPSGGLEGMKGDMAGAAAAAASVFTIAKLGLDIRIIGLIPIVENMLSGCALRPGDVIKSYSGKTVEIGNTDAEGRLILMDALSYAEKKYSPDIIIDLATLTGACVVALGEKIAGVFSKKDTLAEKIVAAGERVHEKCWQMPLFEDYKKLLKSEIADISNIGSSRWGGAITAALFLSEFVKKTDWAHIDIAGPALLKEAQDYSTAGGTGFGVRLLVDFVLNNIEL
jgi:leucyl aminopeptidase